MPTSITVAKSLVNVSSVVISSWMCFCLICSISDKTGTDVSGPVNKENQTNLLGPVN